MIIRCQVIIILMYYWGSVYYLSHLSLYRWINSNYFS